MKPPAGRRHRDHAPDAERRPSAKGERDQLFARIYDVVAAIPPGCVITYGQVAELASLPGAARLAAAAMRRAPKSLPWHRVVGAHGRGVAAIKIRDPIGAALQRELLEAEGVVFTGSGRLRLAEYGWLPRD